MNVQGWSESRDRSVLGMDLRQFVEKSHFATMEIFGQLFTESKHTIEEIRDRELLKRCSMANFGTGHT
jgi:hypothetical protein